MTQMGNSIENGWTRNSILFFLVTTIRKKVTPKAYCPVVNRMPDKIPELGQFTSTMHLFFNNKVGVGAVISNREATMGINA